MQRTLGDELSRCVVRGRVALGKVCDRSAWTELFCLSPFDLSWLESADVKTMTVCCVSGEDFSPSLSFSSSSAKLRGTVNVRVSVVGRAERGTAHLW